MAWRSYDSDAARVQQTFGVSVVGQNVDYKRPASDDFGKVVFALIDIGILRKTEDDCIEDFVGVYEFDEAFAEAELI